MISTSYAASMAVIQNGDELDCVQNAQGVLGSS